MSQFLAPIINEQTLDANGDPLVGGTISVYMAGSSTPATTTSDQAGVIPNTWPITLNTLGLNSQGAVWLTGGSAYKFVIKDASLATLRTIDNVTGINDAAAAVDQWIVFAGTPTYVSATSFTVPGDQTQSFPFGTRIKTTNTGGIVYATVVRSTFSTSTTVDVLPDNGGALDSGLSLIAISILTVANPSLPGTLNRPPFRNRAVNGAMRFDIVYQGGVAAITAAQPVRFTTEMFYAQSTGANITTQRIAGTGYQYATRISGAAAVTTTLFGTRIESFNVYDCINRSVSVQVPISAVGITTVTWNAYVANAVDDWTAKTLLATGTIPLTSTPDLKVFSFNAGANAANGIAVEFVTGALLAGQTLTFQGAFQVEPGPPTAFEVMDYGEDERRVNRYVYTTYYLNAPGTLTAANNRMQVIGTNTTVPGLQFHLNMPVRMRAAPVVTLYNPTTGAFGSIRNETASTDLTGVTFSVGVDRVSVYNNAAAAAIGSVYSLHVFCAARLL